MKPHFLIILLSLFFMSSCIAPNVLQTESDGVRLENPSSFWFKYQRNKFNNGQRIKIDSEKIYETTYCAINDSSQQHTMLARFFPDGQVLFFYEWRSETPFENQVNDSLAGIPGYYAIDGQKLKFQRWTNIYGDQTPETYGLILNDSTLKIYNASVPNCKGLFSLGMTTYECLEAKQDFNIWKKTDKYKLVSHKPSW